jgi:hypothetical protein
MKEKKSLQKAVIKGETFANLIKMEDQLTINKPMIRIVYDLRILFKLGITRKYVFKIYY